MTQITQIHSDLVRFTQMRLVAGRFWFLIVPGGDPGGAGAGIGASEPIRVVTCSIHHAGSVVYVGGKVLLVKTGLY